MASVRHLLALLVIVCGVVVTNARPSSPSLHTSFEHYVAMLKKINASPQLQDEWRKHMKLSRDEPARAKFGFWRKYSSLSCGVGRRSTIKPNSVHKLKAGDIDVVAAMGDSLTAGNGVLAWTILGCLTEYRGRSWSIGGDSDYESGISTLPNILRQFNPNLKGFSTGSGDANSRGAKMNVAVAGAIAQDMPNQARGFVSKLRADSSIDFVNDWKMLTLFIGGNNLCAFCNDLNAHSAVTMAGNVAEALDILRDNVPRLFVNVVEIFDLSPVAQLGEGIICSLVHGAVCSCGHGSDADLEGLSELSRQYQIAIDELVNSGRYDGKEDFTVVNQPFLRKTVPPSKSDGKPDLSYFAPDCFHFSGKGQNAAGKGLWNTILQPVGRKSTEWGLANSVQCPQTDYIPTKSNSF